MHFHEGAAMRSSNEAVSQRRDKILDYISNREELQPRL